MYCPTATKPYTGGGGADGTINSTRNCSVREKSGPRIREQYKSGGKKFSGLGVKCSGQEDQSRIVTETLIFAKIFSHFCKICLRKCTKMTKKSWLILTFFMFIQKKANFLATCETKGQFLEKYLDDMKFGKFSGKYLFSSVFLRIFWWKHVQDRSKFVW